MKSPTSSVGRIDEDGILNGSAMNERSRKTISRTGKKLFGYSIHHGSCSPGWRRFAKTRRSASATIPVKRVARKRISAKFMGILFGGVGGSRSTDCEGRAPASAASLFADLQNRQKRLLWYLYVADRFHALFAGFLLFEKFFLARDVAAITFGQHV